MIKVEGHHGLYKANNGAVLNTDIKAYEKAKEKKKEKQRVSEMENRLDRIEKMLERLLNGNTN
jgi:hypothetical protein